MKEYIKPETDIIKFASEDILVTSSAEGEITDEVDFGKI